VTSFSSPNYYYKKNPHLSEHHRVGRFQVRRIGDEREVHRLPTPRPPVIRVAQVIPMYTRVCMRIYTRMYAYIHAYVCVYTVYTRMYAYIRIRASWLPVIGVAEVIPGVCV